MTNAILRAVTVALILGLISCNRKTTEKKPSAESENAPAQSVSQEQPQPAPEAATDLAESRKEGGVEGGQEIETRLIEGAKAEIEHVFRTHVDGIKAKAVNEPGYSVTEKRWEKLFSQDVMSFATDASLRLADAAIRDGKHHVESKTFETIYVAVSVVPSIDDKKSMTLFPGGYFQLLDGLLKQSGWLQNDRDFAHWIYCYEGKDMHKAHLTFIPAKSLSSASSVWVFAQDLMTSEEKARAGLK